MRPALNSLRLGFVAALLFASAVVSWRPYELSAQAPDILLVVASASAGFSNIDLAALRRAFEGYSTEYEGKRLIPFNHAPGTPLRARFDQALLGLNPDQVARFWIDQKVRQIGQAPRTIPSSEMALRVVATLAGAISYVSMDPKLVPGQVRVLSIDGQRPESPAYPLRAR